MKLKKTTNESATHFLENYKKSSYEALAENELIHIETEDDDPMSEYKKAANKSIEALKMVNDLAKQVLEDVKPVFIKYTRLLTVLQIVTVVSSTGIIAMILIKESQVTLVISILTLLASIGSLIAKGYITPLFGGAMDRQAMSNKLIDLRGQSITIKGKLQTIVFDEDSKTEVRKHIKESAELIGKMEMILSELRK